MSTWPLVDPLDDGIRPAGKPDECFYCHRKVGEEHARDCTCVQKRVKVRYIFEMEVYEPYSADKDFIEFCMNEGSWCASSVISKLQEYDDKHGCLCNIFHGEFVEVVDDTPFRAVRLEGK